MKPKTFLAKSIATLIATGITLTSALHALPLGEQVRAGSATFSRTGPMLDIRTSDRAIINYQSFSIGSGERVNFLQPGAQSITLNRVTAPNPSQIFGTLTSNGQIVLANPYGIFFQNGSVVNVGGLVAGAGHIADSDFLAGRINFSSLTGDVENRGKITAVSDVGLYGAHVSNEGTITSQKGTVTLAAGSSVYVGESGGNIFVGTAPAAIPKARVVSRPGVSNSGTITAPKASLVAGDMYGIAIAQSGTIISGDIAISAGKGGGVDVSGRIDASNRAPGKTGGRIKLKGETINIRDTATLDASGSAGGGGILLEGRHNPTMPTTVTSSGRLLARGEGTGANGGTVQMTGEHVGLLGNAVVDVSGDGGGGTALIGGDYQGRNPDIQNANRTYV
ncbi:MAG: filamentous hemagglutinin N-terminal domain-containing protein, partial [Chthoniobacteraceae bacterium]